MFSRPGNMLALAMVSVVFSFLATLWLAQRRLDVVDDQVATLTLNAAPSLETASDARGKLRSLAMRVHAYVEGHVARDAVTTEYEELRELRDRLMALPRFAGETVLLDALDHTMPPLAGALESVLDAIDNGDRARARQLLAGRLAVAMEDVDRALDSVADFNSAHAREHTLAIRHVRDGANRLGSLLGGVSVILAALVTLLVVRAQRRHARIVAERDRLLEQRASEMEAFAYRVAHDLRGPLAAVALKLSASDVDETLPDGVRKLHHRLSGRVKHMSEIIDGLLEFARAGSADRSRECSCVSNIVESVLADVQAEAEAAGVTVSHHKVAPGVEVACSAGVLSSVVSNLVRNAVKYVRTVERAARRVTVSTQPAGAMLRLCVEDNGPGIERDAQVKIFRPFVRASSSHADGIGLGLATVERLVTAHGGRCGVRSELGVGSTFWIELPLSTRPPVERASQP